MPRRDEARRRPRRLARSILLLSFSIPFSAAHGQTRIERTGDPGSGLQWAVAEATRVAEEKLSGNRCEQIFSDFRGLRGQPVRQTLDALGESGQSYLSNLDFYDGSGRRPCESRETLAFTSPGSRAIFVCGPQFLGRVHRDPGLAAALLIHEELHSLGLGENPPSSREITARVIQRCGK